MSDEARDRLLEIALEEVLGARLSPELATRIIGASQFSGRPPRSRRLWGGLTVAAALLLAFISFKAVLIPPAPPPTIPSQVVDEPIRQPRRVTLDLGESRLDVVVDRLSQVSGYDVRLERLAELGSRAVRPLHLQDVTFLEAIDELLKQMPDLHCSPRPSLPVILERVSTGAGLPVSQVRGALRLELEAHRVNRAIEMTLGAEPSQGNLLAAQAEILEMKGEKGDELAHPSGPFPITTRYANPLSKLDPVPDAVLLSRLRVRVVATYAVSRRVFKLVARDAEQSFPWEGSTVTYRLGAIEEDGTIFHLKVTFAPSGDAAARRLEQVLGPAHTYEASLLRWSDVDAVVQSHMSRSFFKVKGTQALWLQAWKSIRKESMPFEILIPERLETRTVEFDFRDVKLTPN